MFRAIRDQISRSPFLAWLAFLGIFLLALPASAQQPWASSGGDIRFVLANDFLASNEKDDDLYTAALELEFPWNGYQIAFGENIFTDRENDLRFDETYLTLSRSLPGFGPWYSSVGVGVVHVGEGLLGERAQNAVHRLTGDHELSIPYVDSDRFHPTLGVRFERRLWLWSSVSASAWAELYHAFDFQGHTASGMAVDWPVKDWVSVRAGLGARASWAEFEALEPRIEDFGPTWKFGFLLWDKISLDWDYNNYGTKSQHFNIAYHISSKEPEDGRGRMR